MGERKGQRRGRACVALLAALLLLDSCSSSRTLVVSGAGASADLTLRKGDRVRKYATRDGGSHKFEGLLEDSGDSLRFVKPAIAGRDLRLAHPAETLTVSRAEVATVRVSRPDYVATGTVILLLGAAFAGFIIFLSQIPE